MYGSVFETESSSRIRASHWTWLLQPWAPSSTRTRPRYVAIPPSLEIDVDTIFEGVSGAACTLFAPGAPCVRGGVFQGEALTEVAVDPLHVALGLHPRPLRDEVVDVGAPVLDG